MDSGDSSVSGARHAVAPTTLGELTFTATGEALTGVYFPGHRYPASTDRLGHRIDAASDPVLDAAVAQLTEYLAGQRRTFEVPLRPGGDEFSERVWAMLLEIPFGQTTTYGDLARRMGNVNLAQRVGQSVGHNPISIIIPCHRVLGADGSLTGYAGGLERKRALLDLEEPAADTAGRLF